MWCKQAFVATFWLLAYETWNVVDVFGWPSVLGINWQDNVIGQHCVRGVLIEVGVHFAVSSPSFRISFSQVVGAQFNSAQQVWHFLHLREMWSASCSYRLSKWNLHREEKTWPHWCDRKLKWTCEHLTLIYLFFYFETFQSVNHSNVVVSL